MSDFSAFPEFDFTPEQPPLELETMHRLIISQLREHSHYASLGDVLDAVRSDPSFPSFYPRLLELIAYQLVSVRVHDEADVPECLPTAGQRLLRPISGRVTVLYLEAND